MIDPFLDNRRIWERLASRRLLTHSIQHDGLTRTALLYVPRHMRPRGGLPLVLVFHGGASSPDAIARMSAMHRLAEREGFLVAYPAGTQGRSGLTWVPGGRGDARRTGDSRFVRDLIADLRTKFEINASRIYAAGFSIGGSLAYEVACVLADGIAAVAVVSGTMTTSYSDPVRPVPVIHIHGTKDRRVPLEGGRGAATPVSNEWLPVRECIASWCRINGCTNPPQIVRKGLEGITSYRYSGAADVDLWLIEGGFHAWPGGERETPLSGEEPVPTSRFAASEMIWSFFAAHPLRRPAPAKTVPEIAPLEPNPDSP